MIKAVGADRRPSVAFDHLVRKYQHPLLNFVCRYLGDRDADQDIVQEVFLALYRTAFRFEARMRASTWLFRIANNLSMNETSNSRGRSAACCQRIVAGRPPLTALRLENGKRMSWQRWTPGA